MRVLKRLLTRLKKELGANMSHQMDPYGTHLPMLLKCVTLSQGHGGPVLELGLGNYSTPILHEVCGKRRLVSYETDVQWFSKFEDYHSGDHAVKWVRGRRGQGDSVHHARIVKPCKGCKGRQAALNKLVPYRGSDGTATPGR